ncbi:MAG TPA: 3-hydroxyacyl-CoA dehydrogenase NAD-binding domain-containing protein, partial [Longimicrobium sp.]|nr:3-hydroxyacyl-CoA dehydrogenase NAD-binding domain-containing protein [Longimicrobium sp.]
MPVTDEAAAATPLKTVGVVGAGVMGAGVAQDLAQTGHRVVLLDLSDPFLARARAEIERNVRFHGFFTKQKGGP